MRNALAVALALSLQAAALTAPLVHAHPDEAATGHHAGSTVHAHWSGHAHSHRAPGSRALDADDHDRAIFLDAFLAVSSSSYEPPAAVSAVVQLTTPDVRRGARTIHRSHSHDPPSVRSLTPRGPPSVLS